MRERCPDCGRPNAYAAGLTDELGSRCTHCARRRQRKKDARQRRCAVRERAAARTRLL